MPCSKCGSTERYASGDCTPCAKRRASARYKAKRAEILITMKQEYVPHPRTRMPEEERKRRLRLATRRWEAEHPEKVKAMKAASYQRHRAAILAKPQTPEQRAAAVERTRAWAAANPERARELHRRKQANRRGRQRAVFIEPVDPATVYAMHGGRCGICGGFIDGAFHVDHVKPLVQGGVHGYVNVQPAHPSCNSRKGGR